MITLWDATASMGINKPTGSHETRLWRNLPPNGDERALGCVDGEFISAGRIALIFGGALWVNATIASSDLLMLWCTSRQAQYAAIIHMGSAHEC